MSWTIDREVAEWFANRFPARSKYVLTGILKRSDILAVFTSDSDTSENEVVSDRVRIVRVEKASAKRAAAYTAKKQDSLQRNRSGSD
jgi:hypothetical protein